MSELRKILVANRGEIACRIIDSCKKLKFHSVAVYSDVDKNSKHVRKADESIHIGASKAQDSYLSLDKIIKAAQKVKADAIHPCLLYTSPSPRDGLLSRMPSSA